MIDVALVETQIAAVTVTWLDHSELHMFIFKRIGGQYLYVRHSAEEDERSCM